MIKKCRNYLKKIGKHLVQKIFLFTFMRSMLLLTVMIVFSATLSLGYIVHNYVIKVNQEFNEMYHQSADVYVSSISDKLSNYITAMGVVSMSNDLRDNIFRNNVSRTEMVTLSNKLGQSISEMTFFLYQSKDVLSHRLYTYLPADGYYFWNIKKVQYESWFNKLMQSSPQWWFSYSNVTRSNHLTLAGIINNFNSNTGAGGQGYCCQTITVDTANLFLPSDGAETGVYMFDNKTGNIIYDYLTEVDEKDNYYRQIQDAYGNTRNGMTLPEKVSLINSKGESMEFTALTRQVDMIDVTAVILFNPKQMKGNGGISFIYATSVLTLGMMLLLILSNFIYNRRLKTLLVRMDMFDEKNIQLPEPIGGKDEIAKIDNHLLRMQGRIQSLIQDEYTAKMQVMAAHQEALMACINPHFLYNTLNTISAMAGIEGADSTAEMISSLSAMFRYSSDVSRQHVTLRDELKNISDYLYIQSIRYQNAFTYSIDIDESLLDYQVPKLILQPLIENAFKHGFKNQMTEGKGDRRLHVSAQKSEDDITIDINDNGKGITMDKLMEIKEQIMESESQMTASVWANGSIGILNVHRRIRLRYGKEYGLEVISKGEGMGVSVLVHLPGIKG
ncbi:sensor histidine kinase [Anaerocolumna sp. MB42-C2]|uniref:sensor histidine kinase n=1 Tax=Anaerocolumna sp. MB42-C2 TaxID=3070997 RepID=UPI0027DF3095|nr:histidine kinase [Anaerocolumna sp. MB42-C2]WMJ89926.1 histidine kinase [Anaerocolumna sp. MB42-C2]